jgi:hypothetical protein
MESVLFNQTNETNQINQITILSGGAAHLSMRMAPSQSDVGDTDRRIPENAEKAYPAAFST